MSKKDRFKMYKYDKILGKMGHFISYFTMFNGETIELSEEKLASLSKDELIDLISEMNENLSQKGRQIENWMGLSDMYSNSLIKLSKR